MAEAAQCSEQARWDAATAQTQAVERTAGEHAPGASPRNAGLSSLGAAGHPAVAALDTCSLCLRQPQLFVELLLCL